MSGEAGQAARERLVLARWTLTTGSNTQSRAAVVIERGEQLWQASADGNGAVSALFHAVDRALAEVLGGQARLVAYTVTAIGEGPDAEGRVELAIVPPAGAGWTGRVTPDQAAGEEAGMPAPGAAGTFHGSRQGPNTVAASIEAYLEALNAMLDASGSGAGAAGEGGRRRTGAAGSDVVFEEAAESRPANWFEP